jgi:predicted component of type VI protein secretion system
MLARYYARSRDVSRANAMANQFAELVGAETDSSRLAYYQGDVRGMATRIVRACEPETAKRLAAILADCFPVSASGDEVNSD